MKRFISMAIVACMLLMSGCSDSGKPADDDKLSVVTTIFPAYDFARQVFGDEAEVTLLLKPGMESHSYDPTAKDIVKINNCDLFIYNGGESDAWVEGILEGTENVNTLRMMDAVEVVAEEYVEGMEHEHDEHDEHSDHSDEETEYDEHIWTSPDNAVKIIEKVCDAATDISPKCDIFVQNSEEYISEIKKLDNQFEELLSDEERYFVFGDRFPLLYFFRQYDLKYYAAFPGCGSEVEPSAQTISYLLDRLSDDDTIKTVFYIELSNHKLADTLAVDKGLPTAEFHAVHNITADDFEAGETYLSLMSRNLDVLKKALE